MSSAAIVSAVAPVGPHAVFSIDQDVILEGPILFAALRRGTGGGGGTTDVTSEARAFQSEHGNYIEYPADVFQAALSSLPQTETAVHVCFWYANKPNLVVPATAESFTLAGRCIAASFAAPGSGYVDVAAVIRQQQAIGRKTLPSPKQLFKNGDDEDDDSSERVLCVWFA